MSVLVSLGILSVLEDFCQIPLSTSSAALLPLNNNSISLKELISDKKSLQSLSKISIIFSKSTSTPLSLSLIFV
jgi:hypothetical protein